MLGSGTGRANLLVLWLVWQGKGWHGRATAGTGRAKLLAHGAVPAPELESSSPDMFFSDLTVTRLSANYRAKALIPTEGEKNHKKGGLNCVFGNFFIYVLDNCHQVQSLK